MAATMMDDAGILGTLKRYALDKERFLRRYADDEISIGPERLTRMAMGRGSYTPRKLEHTNKGLETEHGGLDIRLEKEQSRVVAFHRLPRTENLTFDFLQEARMWADTTRATPRDATAGAAGRRARECVRATSPRGDPWRSGGGGCCSLQHGEEFARVRPSVR